MSNAFTSKSIARIHREAPLVLGYMNVGASYTPEGPDHSQFLDDNPRAQASLPHLRRGEVDVAMVSFGCPTEARPIHPAESLRVQTPVFEAGQRSAHVMRCLSNFRSVIERVPQLANIALSTDDVEKLIAADKTAFLLHLTGAWCEDDLSILQEYHRQGVRGIHLCVEGLDGVGDASDAPATHGGLAPFGREIVRGMNELGMVIDLAHACDGTAWQVLEMSTVPVISSHTWCRALRPGNRGLPDDLMRAIARRGGVIGLFLVAEAVNPAKSPRSPEFYQELNRRVDKMWRQYSHDAYEFLSHRYDPGEWDDLPGTSSDPALKPPMKGVETVLEHIDHAVQVAGIDHVGLGPDYEMGMLPAGLENAGGLSCLSAGMLQRGYNEDDVQKVLGGNFMRVLRETIG